MDQSAFYQHEEKIFSEQDAYLFAGLACSGQVEYEQHENGEIGEPDEQC